MIVLRLAHGVTSHFGVRVSEWTMLMPMAGWFIALSNADGMFDRSLAFAPLHQYASEKTWAFICLWILLTRLTALIVNGTFRQFVYSPHMRLFSAVAAGWFWALVTLGTFITMLDGRSIGTAFFAYATFTTFELVNLIRASADVGATIRGNKGATRNVRSNH